MVLSFSTWTLNLSLFNSRNRERVKNTLSLSVVAGYYGTDDGKPTQKHKPERKNRMFTLAFISIFFGIIFTLGIIAVMAMYTVYRFTGGKKSFMWYIRHI